MDVRREKPNQNHRSCGHVDEWPSALLTGRVTVKIRLGTAALAVPRSGRSMRSGEVVPRSSTGRPHDCPQAYGGAERATRGAINSVPAAREPMAAPFAVPFLYPSSTPPLR